MIDGGLPGTGPCCLSCASTSKKSSALWRMRWLARVDASNSISVPVSTLSKTAPLSGTTSLLLGSNGCFLTPTSI